MPFVIHNGGSMFWIGLTMEVRALLAGEAREGLLGCMIVILNTYSDKG